MSEHLDLDALADVLAGDEEPAHLIGCPDCAADLAELRSSTAAVTAALSGLPAPMLPADVASRLHQFLPTTATTATILPRAGSPSRPSRRWLPAAAALLVVLAGAGYGVSRLGGSGGSASSTSAAGARSAAAPATDVARNSTGTNYTGRASLVAAVGQLLAGSASNAGGDAAPGAPRGAAGSAPLRAAADPLARLRDTAGLAECLLALLPPDAPSVRPLAVDYASYRGRPAMVVLLPGSLPTKLDVFVVGPACSRANDSTLFYTSADRP
ncbi:MAG: hypothetical protein NVSMB55_00110 [Mycobacteriales bacterium]